jgi:hypothetical protein
MKNFLFLWLVSITALAQTPNRPLEWNHSGYVGNLIEQTINLAPTDTSQVITIKAYTSKGTPGELISPQPTLTRSGLQLKVSFSASLKQISGGWVEIKIGSLVRLAGTLTIDRSPTPTTPRSLSAVQYISLNSWAGIPDKPLLYTQAQVQTLLQGYYLQVTVANKTAANAAATGTQPKIITVTVDESDSNRKNKYVYDGDNQPLGLPLF